MSMYKKNLLTCATYISILVLMFVAVRGNSIFNNTAVTTSSNVQLSNKKICWGLKRAKDHKQPDVGASNKTLLDKYNGICLGDANTKKVYLTFDCGYEAGYMPKILEVLKQNNVKACFFITGHYLNSKPDLVKQMIDEGHIVGNHTVNHKSMPSIDNNTIKKEIMDLHTAVYEKFGYEMKYMRPPKGEFNEQNLDYINSLGYRAVLWSLAYDDWEESKQGREDYGKSKVLENLHNGAVILLHSTSKDNSNILNDVINEARGMGYEFASLDEFK